MKRFIEVTEDKNGVVVEVTSEYRVGQRLHISSSYGFAGINKGEVEITSIVFPEQMDGPTRRDTIDNWNAEATETYPAIPETEPWVFYKYVVGKPEFGEIQNLPLDIFVDHTTVL